MLSKLSSSETMALVDSVRMLNFSAGQRIVKKGDPCKTLFMVAEGKVASLIEAHRMAKNERPDLVAAMKEN